MIRRRRLLIEALMAAAVVLLSDCNCVLVVAAFVPTPFLPSCAPSSTFATSTSMQTFMIKSDRDSHSHNTHSDSTSPDFMLNRRNALQQFTTTLAIASSVSASASTSIQPANAASDELFKPNPLTNTVLEKVRIWNQDEVDNIKYGGELESGSAKPAAFDQYVQLLQPILQVDSDLRQIDTLLKEDGKDGTKEEYLLLFQKIDKILTQSLFDKINFKKAFNAFADNIYYSDPDRANLYLGGGAIPKTTQSIAYLLRNDVLTSVEDMRAEVTYLLKELSKMAGGTKVVVGGDEGEGVLDLDEISKLSKTAGEGMYKYLDLVPPKELEMAKAKFTSNK